MPNPINEIRFPENPKAGAQKKGSLWHSAGNLLFRLWDAPGTITRVLLLSNLRKDIQLVRITARIYEFPEDFVPGTTRVYKIGQRVFEGYDYTVIGTNQVEFCSDQLVNTKFWADYVVG